jgi:hypothetical protein
MTGFDFAGAEQFAFEDCVENVRGHESAVISCVEPENRPG